MSSCEMISELFVLIAEKCGQRHGTPLPKQLVRLGDPETGWGITLNPTGDEIDGVEPYHASVTWNGWPAGIVASYGGTIAAGSAANEDNLCEWLRDLKENPATPEPASS